MVTLDGISAGFKKNTVFENLNFEFRDGLHYALMGESGCGKTTLLNIIAGLVKPTRGKLTNTAERTAYVFQEPRLFDWMSALENITVVMRGDEPTNRSTALGLLSALGISDSADAFPNELSGGMKRRVSIARALAYSPDLLLLDEPFGALDSQTKQCVSDVVFSAMKGKTVIMVTHDISDTEYADSAYLLKHSSLLRIDGKK